VGPERKPDQNASKVTLRTEITTDPRYFNSIVLHSSLMSGFPAGSIAFCRLNVRQNPVAEMEFSDFLASKTKSGAPKPAVVQPDLYLQVSLSEDLPSPAHALICVNGGIVLKNNIELIEVSHVEGSASSDN